MINYYKNLPAKSRRSFEYLLTFLLAAGLLWLAFHNLTVIEGQNRIDFLWRIWARSDKEYLWIMAFLSIVSHLLRAYRWKMLLASAGNRVTLRDGFLSLMVGYLVNLALPRGGEISRCYNLFKLDKTPIEISFGTVIAERSIDVLFLLVLSSLFFYLEWANLQAFVSSWDVISDKSMLTFFLLIALALLVGLGFYLLRNNRRVIKILAGLKKGMFSVLRIKNLFLFSIVSILIWVLYFVMTYCIMVAFPETSNLGIDAVLALLVVGSIAIAIPLPGGIGTYHTLVPSALVMLYGLAQADAIAVVFIFHAWQTVVIIVPGILSLIISQQMVQWRGHVRN